MPCHLRKMHIYIYIYNFFFLCYTDVKICGNLNAKNKMWDIGKGTNVVVRHRGNGEMYGMVVN